MPTAAHSHHAAADPALACASCHMPARTYMVVDPRHDHSFRIPRPDLSVKLGTPNACNDCHRDKPAQWAAAAVESWFGPNRKGFQTLRRGLPRRMDRSSRCGRPSRRRGRRTAMRRPVARASALSELAPHVSPANINLAHGPAFPIPIRWCGSAPLDMLAKRAGRPALAVGLAAAVRFRRGVRIRAVSLLAAVPIASQPHADRERFERAAAEFIAAQRLNADRPEARTTLGTFLPGAAVRATPRPNTRQPCG